MRIRIMMLVAAVALMNACGRPSQFTQNADASEGVVIAGDTCKKIDDYLTQLSVDKQFSGGLLIVKGGKKIFSKGYGWADKAKKIPFTPSTLASIGSITKAFTATGIMKLVAKGKLSVTDSLAEFFPAIPDDKSSITLHQLLTHSSGFHEFLQQDGGDYEAIGTEDFLKRAFAEPLAFKPGEKAVYTNVGMSILGIIIEQVAGMDYEQYLQRILFDSLGIDQIGYRYPSSKTDTIAIGYENGTAWGTHQDHFAKAGGGPYWNLKANGGLEASLNDMFHWVNGFTNHTVLSEAAIEQVFTPHIQEEGYQGQSSFGYGCNIMQSRRGTKMIENGGSNGIYFARIVRLPEEGLVFFMVTNESTINTNMVLPNVTQLYFDGKITHDALAMKPKFESAQGQQVYDLIEESASTDLAAELQKAGISVNDDMVLLEVGQMLMEEKKHEKALVLYKFYTTKFPNIVVAWNDMGDVFLALGDTGNAKKSYEQALKIRPGNPRAIENLNRMKQQK